MRRDRATTLSMAALALLLISAVPAQAQKMKVQEVSAIKATMMFPDSWPTVKMDAANSARYAIGKNGAMILKLDPRKAKDSVLPAVLKSMITTAEKNKWKVLAYYDLKVNGSAAAMLLLDAPTAQKDVVVRQLFYFVNTKNGLYTMQFAAQTTEFTGSVFADIAHSLTPG